MSLKLKDNCKYAILVPTSMGIRITPINGQPVHSSEMFRMQATSAESNVATISSMLGLRGKVLTSFVKGSPIAKFIKSNLQSRNLDFEGPEVEQGGPWGYRHQFNIADSGFGTRGPRVHNDRAGEVGTTLNVKDFDLDRIFGEEGVQIIHLSGLIAALSPETSQFCLELARAAKKYNTTISFDLNHRATFWKGREKELREAFTEIASVSDVLVGNEEDFQRCLGIEGPEAGGQGRDAKIDPAAVAAFLRVAPEATPAVPRVDAPYRRPSSHCDHRRGRDQADRHRNQHFHQGSAGLLVELVQFHNVPSTSWTSTSCSQTA